jgi:hypothetical protein
MSEKQNQWVSIASIIITIALAVMIIFRDETDLLSRHDERIQRNTIMINTLSEDFKKDMKDIKVKMGTMSENVAVIRYYFEKALENDSKK